MRVRELMKSSVISIPAEANLQEASQIFREHGISGAPVADPHGKIVGMISRTDLIEGWDLAFSTQKVEAVMMPLVFGVQADDSVEHAAALMEAEGIHRVVVLEGSALAGILSAWDVVAALARGSLAPLP